MVYTFNVWSLKPQKIHACQMTLPYMSRTPADFQMHFVLRLYYFFLLTFSVTMEILASCKKDVYTDFDMDRYDQLFDIEVVNRTFGLGSKEKSIMFFQCLDVKTICALRATCFALAVECSDSVEEFQQWRDQQEGRSNKVEDPPVQIYYPR